MKVLGVLIGLVGTVLAIWLGVFVMFIPGIEQIVDGFNAEPTDGSDVAWGLLRVLLATTVAGLTFWLGWFLCIALWAYSDD